MLQACQLPSSCGGKPPIEKSSQRRETSNDLTVDERMLRFDGLELHIWYVLEYSPGKRVKKPYSSPRILRVHVTGPQWPVPHGLRVGTPKAAVFRKLGHGRGPGECTEYVNDARQDSVTICFASGKVKSIEWDPWND